jgi:putative oxidoreductase
MNKFLHLHQSLTNFDGKLQSGARAIVELSLRGFISWQFLKSGWIKLQDWPSTLELFREEYQVPLVSPEFAAYLGTGGELIFSVLLMIGLFSRLAGVGLFTVNLMALVSYPILWTLECPAGLNDHFYWGGLLLLTVVWGPDKLSCDRFLQRLLQKNSRSLDT